ncbi:EthD family reductase [Castellaniella caeni]|uniref:EthD family reductase n=1 Tax=Castellaniella caeni TaxID=266123 RepID=UPI000832F760|nr:EthD family reductase [Castellaniella caeni]
MNPWKLLVLYSPPASPDEFRRHYVEVHLPLVAGLPGLLASHYSFDVRTADASSPYFCIWQGDFESAEAIVAAMQSPQGQKVQADAAAMATGGIVIMQYQARLAAL